VLSFEVDLCAAQLFGKAGGKVEHGRSACVVFEKTVKLPLKVLVVFGLFIGGGHFFYRLFRVFICVGSAVLSEKSFFHVVSPFSRLERRKKTALKAFIISLKDGKTRG